MAESKLSCQQCGAELKFEPGTTQITCPYCNSSNTIEVAADETGEQDFRKIIAELRGQQENYDVSVVACPGCGATTSLEPHIKATECGFCGTSIVRDEKTQRLIKPQSLLPFHFTQKEAFQSYKKWLQGLWFAPNKLKKFARNESSLQGIYLPHWTYDALTNTHYSGQRGEHYYVNESYTTRDSEGRTVTKTRRVRKTRWYPARGVVHNSFDDILIVASESLPRKYVAKLEPWDLQSLVAYDERFLSGMKAESYTVDVEQGFNESQALMEPSIKKSIRRDIGGDEQRISHFSVFYNDISFKHILLPVWISAYRYKEKVYRFVINARTGEVQGERPWSIVKIALAALAGVVVIGGIIYMANQR